MEVHNAQEPPMERGFDKKIALCLYLINSFLSGFAVQWFEEGSSNYQGVSLFFTLVGVVILMRWFFLDAQEQRYKFSKPMLIALVALTILAAPFYFFQTRRKAAWIPALKGLGFVAIAIGVGFLGIGAGHLIQLNFF